MQSVRFTPALFFLLSAGACDCSGSPAPDAAVQADIVDVSALSDAEVDATDAEVADAFQTCRWDPEPACATTPNVSVSLSLRDPDAESIELAFGYLSFTSGFTSSMILMFTDNGDADRCGPFRLTASIPIDPNVMLPAGDYEASWRLTEPDGVHTFTSTITITNSSEERLSGPVAGDIVEITNVDDVILGLSGTFEIADECEPWFQVSL